MSQNIRNLLKQIVSFVLVSGIGWILDFSTYYVLTHFFNFSVMYANMISAIPALTYVFSMSSKKIFKNEQSKLNIKTKYFIYFVYQLILVSCISFLGEVLYSLFINKIVIKLILDNLKIIIKIIITDC